MSYLSTAHLKPSQNAASQQPPSVYKTAFQRAQWLQLEHMGLRDGDAKEIDIFLCPHLNKSQKQQRNFAYDNNDLMLFFCDSLP